MKKFLQPLISGLLATLLLVLYLPSHAQTMFRVQMKFPPAGKVGMNYAYQALSLYNNESGTKMIRLKVIVSEASAGTVYEAESQNFECPPGHSTLKPDVIQSVNVTMMHPGIGDYIKRYQSLPGGNYKLCVTVFVAGSNSPAARDCYEEFVIVTDPALQQNQAPKVSEKVEPRNQVKKMFGPYEITTECDKNSVQPGEKLSFRIILKCESLKNVMGFRISAPFPAEFSLIEKGMDIRRKGQAVTAADQEKYAIILNEGNIVLQADEELAMKDELVFTYVVMILPEARARLLEIKNISIETSGPETKNIVSAGPLIEIIR